MARQSDDPVLKSRQQFLFMRTLSLISVCAAQTLIFLGKLDFAVGEEMDEVKFLQETLPQKCHTADGL